MASTTHTRIHANLTQLRETDGKAEFVISYRGKKTATDGRDSEITEPARVL